ncbi:hypothetical protein BBJ28_00002907 [Nothophytophthora sp. Chile5]|nr:hypothetical protein BBJ28_00002907 [Nothophytophthora sp. Chile5]
MADASATFASPPRACRGLRPPRDSPVLTAARVVCRECLSLRGVGALPQVVRRIDGFLDSFSGPGAVANACRRGDSVRLLSYLAARDCHSFWGDAAVLAAMCGHVHVLQWLSGRHPSRCNWSVEVMDSAAGTGHLLAVQWLHANRPEGCTTRAVDAAALRGELRTVQWLHHHRNEGCTTNAMDFAAEAGHLDVVQWLHANRSEGCTTSAMTFAAARGDLQMVQWLGANRSEGCSEHAFGLAAGNGHLAVLQWLYGHQSKRNVGHAIRAASTHGHVAIVQWLLSSIADEERQQIFSLLALRIAKKSSQWHVARWLEAEGAASGRKRQRLQ